MTTESSTEDPPVEDAGAAMSGDEEQVNLVSSENEEDVEVGPMDIEMTTEHQAPADEETPTSWWSSIWCRADATEKTARYQRLVTDPSVLRHSLYCLRFLIFAGAMNSTILQPNYPIMAREGADPESFSSTSPFGFNTATYALPMFSLLGIAVADLYSGRLSDKLGRKPLLLVSMYGASLGSLVMYFLRHWFWGFLAASFGTGLVSSSLPVALAYASDVFRTQREKSQEFGILVGCFVVGQSGGGIVAILMASTGLFAPLWVSAAVMFLAGTVMICYLIEPGDVTLLNPSSNLLEEQDEEDALKAPTEVDRCTMWNIIMGALADNFGSAGLFPICLSPLAFNRFYADFVERDETPILSLNGYKWLSVLVALVVIPTALVTASVYQRIGAAGACVFGNVMTAVVIAALLAIGTVPAPTNGVMAAFMVVLYVGYPTTVFSQLSTSPMLDAISPLNKRGYVQGLNSTFMNLGAAFAPWILGIIADKAGTAISIWTGFGMSLFAAAINVPLMFHPLLGPAPKKLPPSSRPLLGEDKEFVEAALRGSWVDQETLEQLNLARELKGKPYLAIHLRPYEEEKDKLGQLVRDAETAFQYAKSLMDDTLVEIVDDRDELPQLCERINTSLQVDPQEITEIYKEIGQWFADYMKDNGYFAYRNPVLVKQMIVSAFPVITKDKELTPGNLEEALLNMKRVYTQYIALDDQRKYTGRTIFGTGSTKAHYL